jgi:predicted DNA-binding transcriptional regulator AlpA
MYASNPHLNKKNVAELLGVTRQQIYRYAEEFNKKV